MNTNYSINTISVNSCSLVVAYNTVMDILKKIVIISLLLFSASCDFVMERDNSYDPQSDNFILPPARADFSASVTEGSARLKVDFKDQSAGDIAAWEWDFDNDGITDSTEQNPSYTYNFTGAYSVRLKVWERRGLASDETVKTDYIEVTIGYPEMNIIKEDFDGAMSVCSADVDNDGDMDIIGASYWHGLLIWFENIDGSAWIEHKIAENFFCLWSVIPADIDGDGDIDFISANPYSYYNPIGINWWENRRGEDDTWKDNWVFHVVDGGFKGAVAVRAADMDDDGDLDIVGASYEDNYNSQANSEISWWENQDRNPGSGDGNALSWIKHRLTGENMGANFKYISRISITDPDGDGDWDIAYTEKKTGRVSILENRKGELEDWKDNFIEHTVDSGFSAAADVFSADMDGDGDMDLVGVSYGTWSSGQGMYVNSLVCWWENDREDPGTGSMDSISWIKHIVYDNFDGGQAVIAKDIDGDGDMDVIGASGNNDTVIWWENRNGLGTEWIEHVVNMHFQTAYSLDAADVDNDGDVDIIGASRGNWSSANNYYYLSKIAWWEIIY